MEVLLKELVSSSKLLSDFKEMYDYENRLKTFTNWPFVENCKCTPENMAKAGFIHCPSANETDVAKCFFCLIELEGWEPNDDPWEEHTKRRSCGFLSLTKQFDDLTMEEYYMLEMTRLRTFLCKTGRSIINSFEEEVAATRKRLVDNFVSSHQYTPQPPVPIQADPTCPPSESS
ncbi:baculoviral IAP repeat-containing protein 5.1 [Gallus gallus]|uniref:baculoviral IAP repeat-containing protein 5.1 n=1 Tax=Gallus gallus TaxID=9031 RepID=UPI001AE25AB6|nr:baculoviral IAP repeat-containing protein 5.1 [Gallus gallus]